MESAKNMMVRFAPMIYGPTILFTLGEGAVVPLIPVLAANLGADLALSGLIASMLVVGQLCGNIPAGFLVAKLGERLTMVFSGLAAIIGVVGLVLSPSILLLGASVFVIGMCAAAFGLARHAFMTTRVPFSFRARGLALLGGSFRFGMFIGPFAGALLLGLTGSPHSAAWFFAVCLLACVVLVFFGKDPEEALQAEEQQRATRLAFEGADTGSAITGSITLPGERKTEGVFRTMARHRRVLSRLGVAAASLSAVRSARQVVLPLWGLSIGLDAQTISLVVGISGAVEFALFYVSGQVMDKFGRLWASIPSMLLMGAGFLVLAFTHNLPDATMWYAMLSVVIGVGNGLSSGLLLTLGADVAPQHDPAPFLGSWRTLTDAGGAAAPVIYSALAAVATLGIATGTMGAIALIGAIGFWRWVPMFVRRTPAS